MKNAKEWIAEMLEADDDMVEKMAANSSADVFSKQLETVGKDFVASNPATNRTVEITWLYEDPSCVSYEAVTTRATVLLPDSAVGIRLPTCCVRVLSRSPIRR